MKIRLLLLAFILLLTGCSDNKPPVKIVSNSWIGFTPLYYAQEKGWLQEANIELSTVVSLGESMMIFTTGQFDAISGTQYEYQQLREKNFDVVPVIMLDRSNGGDMVMGNVSIDEIRQSDKPIDVVLEINSINMPLFKDFVRNHNLENVKFNFINKDQSKLVSYIKQMQSTATLAVTYIPYNFELQNLGFTTLASTRDIRDLLVIDALYVKRQSLQQNPETYKKLSAAINNALADLNNNPKMFYEIVKHYLDNPSYEDFKSSLNDIEWLKLPLDKKLIDRMEQIHFPYQELM